MPLTGTVSVILNPAAGSDPAAWRSRIAQELDRAGTSANVRLARTEDEIAQQSRAAVDAGDAAVVAAGGDGTVGTVAGVLAGTGVPFGILPLGTLNHFARDLRLPSDAEAALAVVARGRTTAVDVCEVNGRVFVNNSSLGLYPVLVRAREQQQRMGHGKWPAFLWATAAAFRRYPFLKLSFDAGGREVVRTTPFVFIGNNLYAMEGLHIGRRASLRAGRMCVYVLHRTGRWGLLRMAVTAMLGRLRRAGHLDALDVTELWIESPARKLLVATDGEVRTMETPLHYCVRPEALRVLVP